MDLRICTASQAIRSSAVAKGHIAWLENELRDIDADLGNLIQSSRIWRARDNLLQSVPSVGDNLSRTLLASLPELGRY